MSKRQKIARNITELVGKTPLVYLDNMRNGRPGRLAAKLEYMNPSGSIKDRIVLNMMRDAEKRGLLREDFTIIESSNGNTGISLAAFCAAKKYQLTLVIPDSTSPERKKLLKAYGATLITTNANKGMRGALEKAEELHKENRKSFMLHQFINFSNPTAHEKTTAKEIWRDTDGKVSVVVAGIGTGGTITGIGKDLKRKNPSIKIIAVEPEKSATLSGGKPGRHEIQGIGPGFVPVILDKEVIDEVMTVSEEESFRMVVEITRLEGLMPGLSSGAAMSAALKVAERPELEDTLIVVIFPDSGIKYLNTGLIS